MSRFLRCSCAAVAVIVVAALTAAPVLGQAQTHRAFVESSLRSATGNLSILVTAKSSREAAAAVRRAGGRVTSDLWIANAVGATIRSERLSRLANDHAVVSIVDNKTVKPAGWNDWVSDLRITKGKYAANATDSYYAVPVHTVSGGFASISTKGDLLVVNADGSEKLHKQLPLVYAFATPVMTNRTESLYYVADVYGVMYGVRPDGTIAWTNSENQNVQYYYAPGVVASDGSLMIVSYTGTVFAFDPNTGAIRWRQSIVANRAEYKTPAIIGPDDTLYISSDQGDIYAVNSAGVRWSTALNGATKGNYAGVSPVLSGSTLYAVSGAKLVAFDAQSGAIRWSFTANGTLLGAPVIASDGTLIFATSSLMYALTSTGQTKWTAVSPVGAYAQPPVLSADGLVVFANGEPAKGKAIDSLMGFNAANGSVRFSVQPGLNLVAQIVADPDGGVLIATDDTSVYRYDQTGAQTHRIKVHSPITHMSQASETGNILVRLNSAPIETRFLGRLPNAWNGRKDVEAGSKTNSWRFMSNHAVDVGADQLHEKQLPNGAYIRGGDVTVAVVDSGVYWDNSTKMTLGAQLQRQFLGQADYVEPVCPPISTSSCTQKSGYAFHDYNSSRDAYGHGSHVAGTISNKLVDEAISDATQNIDRFLGIAPDARILSVRVLGADGSGSYENVIKGIQYVVENKAAFNVRVMNLSLSAYATVPYFVDPLNIAVERAWQAGIVCVAAAGNTGPFAQTITVPGNNPYVITVGAVNSNRTAGYWRDDIVAPWSATGPTYDGFAKPDVVAPGSQIVSYMFNGGLADANTATLVRMHPDYSANMQLFRMNGTSMATAVTSGVVALMLQVNPQLTPDQVKYRLIDTARWSANQKGDPVFNTFRQGMGRVWAYDAVLNPVDPAGVANSGLNLATDLGHGYELESDLAYHYQGPVQRLLSDDGSAYLYLARDGSGTDWALGISTLDGQWLDFDAAARFTWAGARFTWAGGLTFTGDASSYASARFTWAGSVKNAYGVARFTWAGARFTWAGARFTWAGGNDWKGGNAWGVARFTWAGNADLYSVARFTWAGSVNSQGSSASSVRWIDDFFIPPMTRTVPPPAATTP